MVSINNIENMEWKDFNLELPPLEVSVLAVDKNDGYMEVVDIQNIRGELCICNVNGYSLFKSSKPTHWMYLPKPPKD